MGAVAIPAGSAVIHTPKIHSTAFIAPTAVVLGDVTLGPRSSVWYQAVLRGDMAPIVIGEGAVVPERMEVPPGSLVMGVPARVGRHVDDGLRARIRGTWEHYVAEAERHRRGTFPIQR